MKSVKTDKKTCKKVSNKLIFFIEKSLTDTEMREVEQHLQECADCRLSAKKLKEALSIIEKEKTVKANAFLATKIFEQIDRKQEETSSLFSIFDKVWQPVFYAAFVAIGIFTGTTLSNAVIDTQYQKTAKIQEEEIFLNDFYQEPVESFLLTDNE